MSSSPAAMDQDTQPLSDDDGAMADEPAGAADVNAGFASRSDRTVVASSYTDEPSALHAKRADASSPP